MFLDWAINPTLLLAVRLKFQSSYGCNKLDALNFANPGKDIIHKALMFILELVA